MSHNIETYKQTKKCLDIYGKAVIIKPTGTGKSYIAFQIMQDLGRCKKLVVSPSRQYIDAISGNKFFDHENTAGITYQKLASNRGNIIGMLSHIGLEADEIKLIVLDEVYRAGSKVWESSVKELINMCKGAKLLGLTAITQRRDGNDIISNLFDNIVIGGESSLTDAVAFGELPKLYYVNGVYSAAKELRKMLNRYDRYGIFVNLFRDEYNEIIDKWGIENSYKNTLKKYLVDNSKNSDIGGSKHIVFFNSIRESIQHRDLVLNWFKEIYTGYNVNVYMVNSTQSNKNNIDALRRFSEKAGNKEVVVLITVQMALENFHFNGIKSIVMFGHTRSFNAFFKQIGRGLSSNGCEPYIFDFVDNFDNIEMSETLKKINNSLAWQFIDDTEHCKKEIGALKNKILLRESMNKRQLHKLAEKNQALHFIGDIKLRAWAIDKYGQMKALKDEYITRHCKEFLLTDFIEYRCGYSWIAKAVKFRTLNAIDQRETLDKLFKMIVCNMITADIEDILSKYIDKEYFQKPGLSELYTMVIYSSKNECIMAKKAVEAFRDKKSFVFLYYLDRCENFIFGKGCITSNEKTEGIPKYGKENWVKKIVKSTDLFGLTEYDRAAVYKIVEILRREDYYIDQVKKITDSDRRIVGMLYQGRKMPNNTFIGVEDFCLLNNILIYGLENIRSEFLIKAFEFFRIRGRNSLIEYLEKHSDFYTRVHTLDDKAMSMNYYGVHDKHKVFELNEQAIGVVEKYSNIEMCEEFKSVMEFFMTRTVPVIAHLSGNYTLCSRETADRVSELRNKEVIYSKSKSKVLEDNRGVFELLDLVFKRLVNDNKYVYSGTMASFISETGIFYRLLKAAINDRFDKFKFNVPLRKRDITMLNAVYGLVFLYNMGVNDFGIYENIVSNKELMYKVDSMCIGYRLWRSVSDAVEKIEKHQSTVEFACSSGLFINVSTKEEKAISHIIMANVYPKNTFYTLLIHNRIKPFENISIG